MAPKRNGVIPNAHFKKHWECYVKTWFDQPGRKKRRQRKRLEKAAKIAPRPVAGLLRPVVRCPTFKYNTKVRAGRGFTFGELTVCVSVCLSAFPVCFSIIHDTREKPLNLEGDSCRKLVSYPDQQIWGSCCSLEQTCYIAIL